MLTMKYLCVFLLFLSLICFAQNTSQETVLSYNIKSSNIFRRNLHSWQTANFIADSSKINVILVQGVYNKKVADQFLATTSHAFKHSYYNESLGLMCLSKNAFKVFLVRPFKYQKNLDIIMNKGLIVIEFNKYLLGNIHLNSLSKHARLKQMSELDSLYISSNNLKKPFLILGEFNINAIHEVPNEYFLNWDFYNRNVIRGFDKEKCTQLVIGNHHFELNKQYFIKQEQYSIVTFEIK